MKGKIESFVSVVIVGNTEMNAFQERIYGMKQVFDQHFKHWELIFVDNDCSEAITEIVKKLSCKLTIVKLARRHKVTQALQAGLDCAIGDYIYEFEDFNIDIDWNILVDMFAKCQEGYDFVFCHPKNTKFMSGLFYRSVKHYFRKNAVPSDVVNSSVCTLSSRRGQNRVEQINSRIVNRNLSYSLSGLRAGFLTCDCSYRNRRGILQNLSLMVDSYIYYTNIIMEILSSVAVFFLLISLGVVAFALISYLLGDTVEGWTSTVVYMSVGFAGLFCILALLSKYMDHILKGTMNDKQYVYTDIEKR